MKVFLISLICLIALNNSHGFKGPFRRLFPTVQQTPLDPNDDPGQPLFLTSYLEEGRIDEAKNLRCRFDFESRFVRTHIFLFLVVSNYFPTNSHHIPAF